MHTLYGSHTLQLFKASKYITRIYHAINVIGEQCTKPNPKSKSDDALSHYAGQLDEMRKTVSTEAEYVGKKNDMSCRAVVKAFLIACNSKPKEYMEKVVLEFIETNKTILFHPEDIIHKTQSGSAVRTVKRRK